MRNWTRLILPVALIALMAAPLWAQNTTPPRERPDGPPPREGGPGGPGGPPPNSPSAMLQRLKDRLADLKLTDEQKTKVEALITKTAEEVKATETKLQESMQAFAKDLEAILDEEQLKKAKELTRQGQGPMGMGGGQMIQRMQDAAAKLDLTAEQKEKLKTAFDTLKEDAKELLEKNRNDPQAMREAMRDLMDRARTKAQDILTPEQAQKLRDALRPPDGGRGGAGGAGGREGGRGRDGGNPPPPPPAN